MIRFIANGVIPVGYKLVTDGANTAVTRLDGGRVVGRFRTPRGQSVEVWQSMVRKAIEHSQEIPLQQTAP